MHSLFTDDMQILLWFLSSLLLQGVQKCKRLKDHWKIIMR